MNKREFLKKSAILTAGAAIAPSIATSCMNSAASGGATASLITKGTDGQFTQPDLGYAFDALEPYIDAQTMELHYGKHHAGYTRKLNAALTSEGVEGKDLYEIFSTISSHSSGVRNNGGGYYNHNMFWKFMSPEGGGEPEGDLADALNENFGSFGEFKKLFSGAAGSVFGSGWAWLIRDKDGNLKVTTTPNQDNPLMDVAEVNGTPLLNIDVWEHAYYLKYQNQRGNYIDAYWNVIDWDFVSSLYNEAVKSA